MPDPPAMAHGRFPLSPKAILEWALSYSATVLFVPTAHTNSRQLWEQVPSESSLLGQEAGLGRLAGRARGDPVHQVRLTSRQRSPSVGDGHVRLQHAETLIHHPFH